MNTTARRAPRLTVAPMPTLMLLMRVLVLALMLMLMPALLPTGAGSAGAAEQRRPHATERAARASTQDRCRTLRRQLDRVDARLRTGYGAAEGRRLDERRRELREDLRYYACR